MTADVSGTSPMEVTPSEEKTLGMKRRKEETSIGEVTDLPTEEEKQFWDEISTIFRGIEEAQSKFEELDITKGEASATDFLSEQMLKMSDYADTAKGLRPPKKQPKTSEGGALHETQMHSQQVQQAINSLSKIQEKTAAIYKHFSQTGEEQLIGPLSQFQRFLEAICPINVANIPPSTDIELLNLALTTKTPLTPEQVATIQNLLTRSIGNHDLNRMLKEKEPEDMSKAELFLLDLTFTTIQAPSCTQQLQKTNAALEQTQAKQFTAGRMAYQQKEKKICDTLTSMTREMTTEKGRSRAKEKGLTVLQDALVTLTSQLSSSSDDYFPLIDQQLDPDRVAVLKKLENVMQDLSRAPGVTKRTKDRVISTLKLIKESQALLQELLDKKQEYETKLKDGTIRPTLSLQDLWVVRRHSSFVNMFSDLREKCGGFKPPFSTFYDESLAAHAAYWALREFFDSLPSSGTGDIVFIDNGRGKISRGEKPITTLDEAKQVFQQVYAATGDVQKAIWPLKPLGSKGICHVAYVFTDKGSPTLLEMAKTCVRNPVTMNGAPTSVCFRPNLVQLLTPQGKAAITEKFGPLKDEEIEKKLRSVYFTCQREYFQANEEKFKAYENKNVLHAVKAFINKPLSDMPEGSLIRELYEWGKTKFPDIAIPAPAREEKPDVNERLCSELVAELIRGIQSAMERKLQQEFQFSEPIFIPVIPTDKDVSKYTVDSLLDEINRSGAYSRAQDSLAVRLYFDLPPTCPALQ